MLKTFLSSILVSLACFVAVPAAAQQKAGNFKDLSVEILKLVNKHRTGMGLGALQMNDIASVAAEKHSHNMATNKVPFGHDGFDARMAGLRKQIKPVYGWAENVAYGSDDAKEIVDMWLHSPGHKKNIEDNYNLTGIGIAKSADGSYYYTQIFLNKEH
jgi:uncharacterized protein YkwD